MKEDMKILEEFVVTTRFENASKEASWAKYHANATNFSVRGLSAQDTVFVSMIIFERILKRIWQKDCNTMANIDLTNAKTDENCEDDIIAYIAGHNLCKLIRKYGTSDHKFILALLTCYEGDDNASHIMLTSIKDRGRLTYVTEDAFDIYKSLEETFTTICTLDQEMPRSKFLDAAIRNTSGIFGQSIKSHDNYEPTITDQIIESTFKLIAAKYFTTRIHHRCKIASQKFHTDARSKAKKGLRTTLKKQ